jgi:pyruvate/2-oxoglutarate/acetoin dehydrogenase E1 component
LSTKQVDYYDAPTEAIAEEAARNPRVLVMGEDVTTATLKPFTPILSILGERAIDTPISEASFIGVALGAALTGMRPVVCLNFVDLAPLAMDQIANQIAKARYMFGGQLKAPVIVLIPTGASGQSAAHHSQSLESMFVHVPGLKVAVPSTPYDAKGLMKTALKDDNPVIFLQHKSLRTLKQNLPTEEYYVPYGKADVKRQGSDVTIVAWLNMVQKSLRAAELLEKQGISVEIVDPRTLVPFDEQAVLDSVAKTGRLVIVEEECKRCGAGAEVAAMVAEKGLQHLKAPVRRVAAKDAPIPYAAILERFVIPQVDDIVRAVKEIVPL